MRPSSDSDDPKTTGLPDRHQALLVVGLATLAGLCAAAGLGPQLSKDSASYIDGTVIRTVGYPLFLDLLGLLTGGLKLHAAVFLQTAFWILTSAWLAWRVGHLLAIPRTATLVGWLVLLVPLLPPHFHSASILTEPLAFSLFCLWFERLLTGVLHGWTARRTAVLGLIALVLIAVRPQFLFIPLFMIIAGLTEAWRLRQARPAAHLLAAALIGFVGATLADQSYRYLSSGSFERVPFTGTQLVVLPLYQVDRPAIEAIRDDGTRDLLLAIKGRAEDMGYTRAAGEKMRRPIHGYGQFYNAIRKHAVRPALIDAGIRDPHAMDRMLITLSVALIKADPWAVAKGYLENIIWLGFKSEAYAILFALLMSALGIHVLRRQVSAPSLVLFYGLAVSLANVLTVCSVEPALTRYTFYGHSLVIMIIVTFVLWAAQHPTRFKSP